MTDDYTPPLINYKVDGGVTEEQFDELCTSGIVSMSGQDGWSDLTFGFLCGCDECPQIDSLEQAREVAETSMTRLGLSWTYLGIEIVDYD